MWAIYKRELQTCLRSFIGFLFIGVTLFFLGLYFTVYNLMNGYPYFSYVISSVVFLFLISVPVLTMRILAEEKRNKTDQLILTAPVSVGGVVMGKFLALTTIFAIPTGIICTYPLILSRFGMVPLGNSYLAILAFFLYGMACIAIGLLVSSLTESQVIAAVLGFALLFLGYMMSSICSLISTTGNLLTRLLNCFDMYTPFNELLNGTLNLDAVVYFATLTGLVLFLTAQSIQKRRYSVSVKAFSVGAYSIGMIVAAVAVVVAVNLVIGELPGAWTAIDLTAEKLYSLTDQTKEFVRNMDQDVTIYVLANQDSEDITMAQTLQRYDDLSGHITVEYVDPTVNPTFHTKYTDGSVSINSLIVVSDKRSKVIDAGSFYESSYDYQYYTSTITGYDGEGQITSALDYVTGDDMPKMYITEGHGEYALSNTFIAAVEKENMDYETVNLLNYEEVPEDAACLFINAPTKDFSADDSEKILRYLDRGGKVIAVAGYTMEEQPDFNKIMEYMGLSLTEGLVVEGDSEYYYRNPYYLLPELEADTYTAGIYSNYYIFAPFSQGILVPEEAPEGVSYTAFMNTSDQAFAKSEVTGFEDYSRKEGDQDGPFAVAVEAVKELDGGEAVLVLYSCDQLFTDEANQIVSGANQMLFTNTISGFSSREGSVSIPVKSYEVSTLVIKQSDMILLAVITTLVLPLGSLILGFVIWFRRRKR